ncbi:MAG TPA: hypothetical protein DHW82_02635 [Spirochaetia bacterium]|nr:MAG: hypothetical protein A2Y41_10505 [Spirochaetes bacterium GWB1_36_13]HCL55888.1 hypothetical protein [Spirochaetia bacterium]
MKKSLKYIKSFLVFFFISGLSIGGIAFIYKSPPDFSGLSAFSIGAAFLISILSIYVEGERMRVIGIALNKKIPLKAALESIMGRELLSAITPLGTGGQPLGIYILNRYGFSIGESVTISYLETFYTLLVLFTAGIVSLIVYSEVLESALLWGFLVWSFGSILYFFFFSYFSISKPRILKKIGLKIIQFLSKIKIIKPHRIYSIKQHMIREVKVFHTHIKDAIRTHWFIVILLFIFSLAFWVLRFLSVYPIVLALGYKISLLELIAYQMIITSVNYFSVTPGSSGTTEGLGSVLFRVFIPIEAIPTFITLWRFFSYYLIIFLSGIGSLKIIRFFIQEKKIESDINTK